eukprot:GHRQ01028005.1.p3 GENE.GHRQ01028005.1~~GHRQ01028005.1.p3  ORF type:complete len:152 (-),score=50.82 GHRQ01028005.1:127-582(-)
MRICFELLDMLKAHKKAIRRATVNTFGYIAKAIGPQDVLVTLLNNLKAQERQNRVCTTVAIAIVAETCAPFTVLPALMNEYRVPELNVQNGERAVSVVARSGSCWGTCVCAGIGRTACIHGTRCTKARGRGSQWSCGQHCEGTRVAGLPSA